MKKTVNINGEKIKVDFYVADRGERVQSEETISYYSIEGSASERRRVKHTLPKEAREEMTFSINGTEYKVEELFIHSLRKENVVFSKYFVINNQRFNTEKKVIEYILTK